MKTFSHSDIYVAYLTHGTTSKVSFLVIFTPKNGLFSLFSGLKYCFHTKKPLKNPLYVP